MDITLSSLKSQTVENFEVLIADNASTDHSVEVIKKHKENGLPIQYVINPTNIGFAGNLDKVGGLAKAPWMIMLSSDDVVNQNALAIYNQFILLHSKEKNFALCSTFEKIDSNGKFIEYLSPSQSNIWLKSDIDGELSKQMGFDVYKVAAPEMLKRCLTRFLNPFNFASTCYPKVVYEKVGGYGGGRLYNPDKWFHWKLLTELDYIYYLDCPLFQYRWHNNNQSAQQERNQILKYWLDEYRNCFELTPSMLKKAGLTKSMAECAFIYNCIDKPVLLAFKASEITKAIRLFAFGIFCYPVRIIFTISFMLILILLVSILCLIQMTL